MQYVNEPLIYTGGSKGVQGVKISRASLVYVHNFLN